MKKSQFIDSLVLQQLVPERHSFGAIKSREVIEDVVWHQHRETEIIYMQRAYGTFLLGDRVVSCDAIDDCDTDIIFIIGSLLAHSFFYQPKAPNSTKTSNVISIFFHENSMGEGFFELPEMKDIKNLLKQTHVAFSVRGEARKRLAPLMEDLCASEGIQRLICFLRILEIISDPIHLEQVAGHSVAMESTGKDFLTRIIRHLYANYQSDLRVGETAEQFNMSVSAFSSYFKKYTGQTFVEFLNRLRISKACERLLATDEDITTIAFDCGFHNLSNFNRRFRQYKHKSPRDYRKKFRCFSR